MSKRRIFNFTDLETTGSNEPEERIIEAGFGLYDADTEELIGHKIMRIDPLVRIKPKAQKVHGISADDVRGMPTFDIVAPDIVKLIEASEMVIAHNGDGFDFLFLDRELKRVGQTVRWPRKFDTMLKARWATYDGKNPKLGELARCLGVPYDPSKAHGSRYDLSCMAQCFFEARRLGWFAV